MGAFGAGLVQGATQGQAMMTDLENRKQQAELFKLKSKQLKLETDMQEKQLAAQGELSNALFKGPDMRQVESQGPGAPIQLPQEMSDNPTGLRDDARWGQELKERGPGAFTEGPRPAPGQAPIPGTEGVWANLSPQYKDIAGKVLAAKGGDIAQTMDVLNKLTPGIFPKQPFMQTLGKDQALVEINPATQQSRTIAQGPSGDDGVIAAAPGSQLKNKKTGANIGDPVPSLEKPDKIKNDLEKGADGKVYQVSFNENGRKIMTEVEGQGEKPPTGETNPVNQYIDAHSDGLYSNAAEAHKAGRHDLVKEAERVVREDRPNNRAILVGQAMTGEVAKREEKAQEIKQAQPLAQKERSDLLDRKSLLAGKYVRPAPGTSIGEANRGDYVQVDNKQLEQLRNMDKAAADMDSMFNLVEPLITATDWKTAKSKQFIKLHGGAATGFIPEAATYQKSKAAATSTIAKTFGGETGVMTDTDITRWTSTFVEFGDTVAVKNAKRKLSTEIRDHAINGMRRILAGDDINSVRTDVQQKIQPLLQKGEKINSKQAAPPAPAHIPKEYAKDWQDAYMESMQGMVPE